jgi:hypothetical protein
MNSEYIGVTFDKACGKWIAKSAGQYLGHYENPLEAAMAYNRYVSLAYGDEAVINILEGFN